MRVTFQQSRLILVPETEDERAGLALWAQDCPDHVFRLVQASERGATLSDLGSHADACRVPINIVMGNGDSRWWPISNLAATPFMLHGRLYASVEGFWQGLKFADANDRARVARLAGSDAKRAGPATPASFVYENQSCISGSREHWRLMELACRAKFAQNSEAQDALLATAERPLTHITPRDSVTIPGAIMANIWMKVRAGLRDGSGTVWLSLAAQAAKTSDPM